MSTNYDSIYNIKSGAFILALTWRDAMPNSDYRVINTIQNNQKHNL